MKKIMGLLLTAGILLANQQENKEIRYNKGLSNYSLFKTDKEGYKDYLKAKQIEEIVLKQIYNQKDNPKGIVVSAYAYDYGYGRTDLAEPYYELFNTKKVSFEDKLRYMDYLLRTGRINEIETKLEKSECAMNFKQSGKCFYYLGIVKYLKTGDNRNSFLNLTKATEEKAKEIYNLDYDKKK